MSSPTLPPESPTTSASPPAPPLESPTTSASPPSPAAPPTSSSPAFLPLAQPPPNGGLATGALVGIGIGGLIVLVGMCIFVIFYRRRNRRNRPDNVDSDGPPQGPKNDWQQNAPPPPRDDGVAMSNPIAIQVYTPPPLSALGLSPSAFSYEELSVATNGFSGANFIGEGGFGYVHKGVLPNGKVIAIKQMKSGSAQGEREFRAEIEVISRVHHRHLVSLVGYCISGAQRMLVYEFVPNYTLHFHLHGKKRLTMNWPTRMKIALGSAKGLAYLHEDCQPKIIHRDIKAANILLEYNFDAKVADFGLAKFSLDTDTHVSTRVMGSFGYLAPEYAASGKLTYKSDVFSFGVVLLELITGCQPLDKTQSFTDDSMVEWARPLLAQALENGNFDALVEPRLHYNYNSGEMARMVACAAACVRHSAQYRPRMSQIVRALEGNLPLDDLNEGMKPGNSRAIGSFESSQEQVTSEGSGPSSDSALLQSVSSSEGQQTTQEMELGKLKNDAQYFG